MSGLCGCPHGCKRECDDQARCPFCWNGGRGCPVLFHGKRDILTFTVRIDKQELDKLVTDPLREDSKNEHECYAALVEMFLEDKGLNSALVMRIDNAQAISQIPVRGRSL